MGTLIFLLTFLTLSVLLIIIIVKAIRRLPVKPALKIMLFIIAGYLMLWLAFYFKSTFTIVPLDTDVCFDDWCATITGVEKGAAVQKQFSSLSADSTWIILDVSMSNRARRIAQKPSEPRIHLLDEQNHPFIYSYRGQHLLETVSGAQPGIDARLNLHQTLKTKLVFAVPVNSKSLKVLIEEGPFITQLLFTDDQPVFIVH